MTITLTEMLLFIWGIAMTVLWLRERGESQEFKFKTAIIMKALADGKAVFAKDVHGEVEGIVPTKGE
jgi:hypothetical protein